MVVSSWCSSPKLVSIHPDWAALGMKEGSVTVAQPAIAGVQHAKDHGDGSAPLAISGAVANGGAILVLTPHRDVV